MVEQIRSQETSIVCMDATHETNGYDFLFVTVLTKDGSGEGLPLPHFSANHVKFTFLESFLRDF